MRTRWIKSLYLVRPCWVCLTISPQAITQKVDHALRSLEMEPLPDAEHCFCLQVDGNWGVSWRNISASLTELGIAANTQVGVVAGEEKPVMQEVAFHHKTVEETDSISDCLWLLDIIAVKQLSCSFMPVVDRRGEIFGYESLVRGAMDDRVINGGEIFKASKVLQVEYLIDRHLHELAIQEFVAQKLSGFLFINFIPGFIQRPEFYLDGLAQALARQGLSAKQIVLDCTNSENPRDIQHLKSIAAYCRTRGYQVALDDIESAHTARRILQEMRPDFIKLDMRLVQKLPDPEAMDMISEIAALTQNSSCSLIAEGVETEDIRRKLEDAGILLYQGYLFSPPKSKTATKKQRKA